MRFSIAFVNNKYSQYILIAVYPTFAVFKQKRVRSVTRKNVITADFLTLLCRFKYEIISDKIPKAFRAPTDATQKALIPH